MNHHKFDEAVSTARELLKEKPDFVPALNNLSLILYMNGDVAEAVSTAEKVLETKPDNFHALGNLVRFSVFLGKRDDAEKYAELLRKTESPNPDLFVKKIEAFSFLGDDAAVVEKEFEKSKNLKSEFAIPQSYAKHLAAFAFYRLGDEKKAEKLWEEIIEEDISFEPRRRKSGTVGSAAARARCFRTSAGVLDSVRVSRKIIQDDFKNKRREKFR